jgi:hypothetical protein
MKKLFRYFIIIALFVILIECYVAVQNSGADSAICVNKLTWTGAAYALPERNSNAVMNKVNDNINYQQETKEINAANKSKSKSKRLDIFKILIDSIKFLAVLFSIFLVILFINALFKRREIQRNFNPSMKYDESSVVTNDKEISELTNAVVSFVKHRIKL